MTSTTLGLLCWSLELPCMFVYAKVESLFWRSLHCNHHELLPLHLPRSPNWLKPKGCPAQTPGSRRSKLQRRQAWFVILTWSIQGIRLKVCDCSLCWCYDERGLSARRNAPTNRFFHDLQGRHTGASEVRGTGLTTDCMQAERRSESC